MEVTELISTVQSHLDSAISAPVLVSGSEQRPVPAVLIEDWTVQQLEASMTRYETSLYDDQGNEEARVYKVPYDCRVSFMVRDVGEVGASELHDRLRKELFKAASRPHRLSSRISRVELNSGGGVNHQFVNPSESEFNQTATFTSSLLWTDTEWNTIEQFNNNFEITDTI